MNITHMSLHIGVKPWAWKPEYRRFATLKITVNDILVPNQIGYQFGVGCFWIAFYRSFTDNDE